MSNAIVGAGYVGGAAGRHTDHAGQLPVWVADWLGVDDVVARGLALFRDHPFAALLGAVFAAGKRLCSVGGRRRRHRASSLWVHRYHPCN